MVNICGVEEAGRGPVIGPLVMAGVLINEKDEVKLKNIGVKDSKLLTPKQREELFDKIKKIAKKHKIIILTAEDVDDALNSDSLNLNWLEAETSAKIINEIKPDKAILDCPSNNIKKYSKYVENLINNKKIQIVAEHKADVNYVVVGAASILAKVTRDREIEKIKKKIGRDFGSGYPADPRTKDFLEKNYKKYPEIFRKTWVSYQKVVKSKKQSKLGEF